MKAAPWKQVRVQQVSEDDLAMPIDATRTPEARKRPVTKLAPFAAIVLVATTSLQAHAAELRPVQGMSLQLGDLHGIAYYIVEDAGYSVVATLAGQDGTPVRFESTLLPGQKVVVSIPGHRGSQGQTVEFVRQGRRMLVETTPPDNRLRR
ncbi:MAG: hypothetical protein QOD93_6569 [Acetobacteraceae bacterium]|jgi:hypothetical protein|nr:hypothetical protein [Acetobacteraceae bacterium]